MDKSLICFSVLFSLVLFSGPNPAPVEAAQCAVGPGAVIELSGTPHLFIMDEYGVLHWGGDTRGLAERYVDWNRRCAVDLDTLWTMPRGNPWLSSGLPKIGDPIFLSKWETEEPEPTLLHIQSITDVELFGIDESNYTRFVMGRREWEARYGFEVGALAVGPLPSATALGLSRSEADAYHELLGEIQHVLTAALYSARQVHPDPAALLPALMECERAGLIELQRTHSGNAALSATQRCLVAMDLGGPFGGPMPPPYLGPFPPGQLEAPGSVWATPLSPSHVHVSWLDTRAEAGFRIYVGDPSSTTRTLVAEVLANVTSRDIQGLSVDTRYCYWVSGFNYAGESPLGGPACARTPGFGSAVPVAPTNLEVARTDSRSGVAALRLTWIDRSSNETSFQIWRGDQLIAEVGANVTTYTDSTWTPSITNCYRVVAASSTGEATSPEVCAAGGLGNPPAAPTNLSILTSGVVGDLLLEWTDTSNNESGFRVIRNNVVVATLEPNVTSYRDPSPSPVLGCYVVEAFNSSGEARSNQACAP